MTELGDIRKRYDRGSLDAARLPDEPIAAFQAWFADAAALDPTEANAMCLSTVTADGRPRARFVLLKDVGPQGFVFYSNDNSAKGAELAAQPFAALTFYWAALERQVRIEGHVVRVADEVADAYFASRPRESQIGAWASAQSSVVESRDALEAAEQAAAERFAGAPVPRPPHWGGYCVVPSRVEFWQGRPGRLHDRVAYERSAEGAAWERVRLAP